MLEADYVIVGGGTAGCVLANRLSADPQCQVLVLEAGAEATSPWIAIPAGVARLYAHPTLNWRYWTEPEPALDGRRLYWPRGKVLGGTSSLNGMTFVRGQPADYDAWTSLAGDAWSWQAVLPYFKAFEDSPFAASPLRGSGGPFRLGPVVAPHPLSRAFLASAIAAGVPANDDCNGVRQEGIGFTQLMLRDGVRVSAASAYLAPVRDRPNLRVVTKSLVRRITFANQRATGVEFERGGTMERSRARREVLLCGGTVASPHILLLSGIGDAAALAAHGITVVADRPAVGRNMQEQVRAQLVFRTCVPSFNREARGLRLLRHVVDYALHRRGLLAVSASQVNGFARSSPAVDRPDLQLVFRPSSGDYRNGRFVIHDYQGVMAMVGLLRPRSRGHVTLGAADPHAPPRIVAGHLTDAADVEPLIQGIRLMRRIFATRPLADDVLAELRPGPDVSDDAALRAYVHATADSLYHAVGTCAMGTADTSVTTPDLRVRGVDGLRVVDASVMPLVPSGNTTAAVLMIAERAADFILAETRRVARPHPPSSRHDRPDRATHAGPNPRCGLAVGNRRRQLRSAAPGRAAQRCSTPPGTPGCATSIPRLSTAMAQASAHSDRRCAGAPREEFVLSTKVGRNGERAFDYSADGVRASLARSLARLQTGRVDVALIHDVDPDMHGAQFEQRFEEAMTGAYAALAAMRAQGEVGAVGIGLKDWDVALRMLRAGQFDCVMLAGGYTLLQQGSLAELLPWCIAHGVSVLVAAPFNTGILATGAIAGARYYYRPAPPDIVARTQAIERICAHHEVPLAAAALQFPLYHPAVAGVVVGHERPEEVARNLALLRHDIPPAFWADLKDEGALPDEAPTPG